MRVFAFIALFVAAIQGAHTISSLTLGPWIVRLADIYRPVRLAYSPLGFAVVALLVFVVTIEHVDRRTLTDFGFRLDRRWWRSLGVGVAFGVGIVTVVFLIELFFGVVRITAVLDKGGAPSLGIALAVSFVFVAGSAIFGEIVFCAYPVRNIYDGLSQVIGQRRAGVIALLTPGCFFVLLSAGESGMTPLGLASLMIIGMAAAATYLVTGQMALMIGIDIAWNFAETFLFGYPIPGDIALDAGMIRITQSGPDWLTGGAYGPEAGVIGFGVLVIAVILAVALNRRRFVSLGARALTPEARV